MKKGIVIFAVLTLLISCGPDKYVRLGNEASTIGEWYEASLQYAKAYSKIPVKDKEKRGKVAYMVGDANRKLNYVAKALAGYRNAARYKNTDTLTYFYMAQMECMERDYKNAAKDYEKYLELHPGDKASLVGLQTCATAPELKKENSGYTVHEDKFFNSRYDDYSPVLYNDQLFFSSTRKDALGKDVSGVTGMKSGDIFFTKKDEKGKWKKVESLPTAVNTLYDEGSCAFSPDGRTMYFTRCRWDATFPRLAEIYSSTRSDAAWSVAQICPVSRDTLTSFAHPAVSPDGKYLYFVSNMPGGQGGLDIWRSEMTSHGFGAMENLGPDVNTPGNEMFPTFRPNGDLYYSSNGKVGMGGLDLYCAVEDTASHKWNVKHLPSPMNSNGDDFGMTFEGVHNRGYFSSNRSNLRGWDKIYTFECPEVIQSIKGWVYEQDGYELPKALVYMVGDDGTNKKLGVGLDGSFETIINPNVHYLFLATCEGYMNINHAVFVKPVTVSHEDTLQFPLPSAQIPVLVHNVFYDFNKAIITPASIPALNALVNLLKQNPSIAIELSSHCDYRGSQEYNLKLSQRRAEAVVKYLTSHGISEQRVVAKGYGKLKPKVITGKFAEKYPFLHLGDSLTQKFIRKLSRVKQDTCNALNRRTEFSVLKTTYGLLDKEGKLNVENMKAQEAEKKKEAAEKTLKVPAKADEKVKNATNKSKTAAEKSNKPTKANGAAVKKAALKTDTVATKISSAVAQKADAKVSSQDSLAQVREAKRKAIMAKVAAEKAKVEAAKKTPPK